MRVVQMSWLRKRAEEEAEKCVWPPDSNSNETVIADAIEAVAREFAERALKAAEGETVSISMFIEQALKAADKE